MKVVWEKTVYLGNAPVFCAICGYQTRPIRNAANQLLLAVIYDHRGVACGEACADCVAAGSRGVRARLQDRIQSVKHKLSDLEALAQGEIQMPSLEEEFQIHRREYFQEEEEGKA